MASRDTREDALHTGVLYGCLSMSCLGNDGELGCLKRELNKTLTHTLRVVAL
ncbi:predicted protein [Sclerotinia sclerotiorum 1980 UF-70]|uniref:Uncharacterized protein n=1 Tax=Sclerotinia sclerotiorum (strain ATCC 18683 / 1980 / Ss-1) TaxID=665079 RepID=A7F721_SCLS1|nr:predicted protein [Sclerotinia sclerotiorum 1980 UF-70]EDN98542.1 predicted protein [Sclerotinia sclerotiorum 1980 UF-70]